MKKNLIFPVLLLLTLASALVCCSRDAKDLFELKGTLSGITDGKAILKSTGSTATISDTIPIKNGEFVFKGNVPEPVQYILEIEGKEYPRYFYAENVKMTLTGHADSLFLAKITGGSINEAENAEMDKVMELFNKYLLDTLNSRYQKNPTEQNMARVNEASEEIQKEFNEYRMNFIRQNPSSYYSAIIVEQMSYGKGAEDIEKDLAMLDTSLRDFQVVEDLYLLVENLKASDISVSDFVSDAPDMEFAPDKSFAGASHRNIVYLALLPDNHICGLRKDGAVCVISPQGNTIREFPSGLGTTPSAMAVDPSNGNIYVMGTKIVTKETEHRGKTYKVEEPSGVECLVFDAVGNKLKTLDLKGLKSVTGAKMMNKSMIVADQASKSVVVINTETCETEASISDLRSCCMILDFAINKTDEILVANLGAFRVQAYDKTGAEKYAFGRRGQSINDFHGCCNPVNIACLTTGAIVTVEKDPTRIKVYTRSGASQVEGVKELVKGCDYIPMVTDSNNYIYLASMTDGIVKCAPVISAK